MTSHTALSYGFVLEDIRTALSGVTLDTGRIGTDELRAMSEDGISAMRLVAIRTAHFSREQWMAVRKVEFTALIQMTLEATFRRLTRIDDRACGAAALDVRAARTMAGLTTDILRVCRGHTQTSMRCVVKTARDSGVALRAFSTADKFSACDLRRRHHGAIRDNARHQQENPKAQADRNNPALRPTTWIK